MTTEKLFTVAGTATQNGVTKVRFANDMVSRIKILSKNNCTNINLVELPRPMSKMEALAYLQETGVTEGDAGVAVANKLASKPTKAEVKVKSSKPSLANIAARGRRAAAAASAPTPVAETEVVNIAEMEPALV